jgi:hypothetical protein
MIRYLIKLFEDIGERIKIRHIFLFLITFYILINGWHEFELVYGVNTKQIYDFEINSEIRLDSDFMEIIYVTGDIKNSKNPLYRSQKLSHLCSVKLSQCSTVVIVTV